MSGKNSHFPVGELIFTTGTVRKIWVFRLIFLPFLSHFPQPHPSTTLHNPHPVRYARYFPMSPAFAPFFPPIFLHFPPFPLFFSTFPFPPIFQTPKSWFGQLVTSVTVSADA